MVRRVRGGIGLLCLVMLAACGGGGHEPFIDDINPTPDPNATPGPQGDAALIEFVPPDASSTTTTTTTSGRSVALLAADPLGFVPAIGPVGSDQPQASLVTFRVLNAAGRPAKNKIIVDFSLEGPTDASLSEPAALTSQGFVSTVLTAGSTPGNATVVARVRGTDLVARSTVVAIARPRGPAVALEFVTLRVPGLQGTGDDEVGTPRTRSQLGIRGSGVNQSIEAVFLVLDAAGAAAVDGTIIDFSLFGPNGGEAVFPTSAPSISGFVSVTISTGTRPGPVEVEARVHGTAIIARAIPLSIGGALNPAASSLSLAAQCLNVAGSVTFGLTDIIRAGISDQFHNPIPIGSVVSFFTEGGGIASQGVLTDDQLSANATLITQAPVPFDHRVTVLGVTTGQETFTDLNANGQFDPGEPFEDLPPEPFLDENENGVYDFGEFFIDRNNNGVYDGTPNGVWDDQILISASIPIIFSGHTQLSVDPSSFSVPAGGSVELTLFVRDEVSQPLVGGTKIDITGTNVTVSPKQFVIPDTAVNPGGLPVPGLTQFTVIVSAPAPEPVEPTPVPSGVPTPEATSTPVAKGASVTITVTSDTGGGQQNRCPGGNGNVSVTIPGEIGG